MATKSTTQRRFTLEGESRDGEAILQKIEESETPWRDADVLRFLYHDCALSLAECGDRLGVEGSTVGEWMDRLGVEKRGMREGYTLHKAKHSLAESGDGDTQRSGNISRFIEK